MATDDLRPAVELPQIDVQAYLDRVADLPAPQKWEPGDLTRLSQEAMVRQQAGTARVIRSSGNLRFTGAGALGHSADLADVGLLSSAWQKAVTATGAALEDVRGARGRIPVDIALRTTLLLTASPSPGSVVFHVEPKQPPLLEVEPHGQTTLAEEIAARPLADRAVEALVELLATATTGTAAMVEAISGQLSDLGPRVGSAVDGLARAIEATNVTLDASWREPAAPTRRAVITPSEAKFIADVVEGRGLNATVETMTGTLGTISDRQKWVLHLGEETIRLDIAELPAEELTKWKVHDLVEVDVRVALHERPDGRMVRHHTLLCIRPASGPSTPFADGED